MAAEFLVNPEDQQYPVELDWNPRPEDFVELIFPGNPDRPELLDGLTFYVADRRVLTYDQHGRIASMTETSVIQTAGVDLERAGTKFTISHEVRPMYPEEEGQSRLAKRTQPFIEEAAVHFKGIKFEINDPLFLFAYDHVKRDEMRMNAADTVLAVVTPENLAREMAIADLYRNRKVDPETGKAQPITQQIARRAEMDMAGTAANLMRSLNTAIRANSINTMNTALQLGIDLNNVNDPAIKRALTEFHIMGGYPAEFGGIFTAVGMAPESTGMGRRQALTHLLHVVAEVSARSYVNKLAKTDRSNDLLKFPYDYLVYTFGIGISEMISAKTAKFDKSILYDHAGGLHQTPGQGGEGRFTGYQWAEAQMDVPQKPDPDVESELELPTFFGGVDFQSDQPERVDLKAKADFHDVGRMLATNLEQLLIDITDMTFGTGEVYDIIMERADHGDKLSMVFADLIEKYEEMMNIDAKDMRHISGFDPRNPLQRIAIASTLYRHGYPPADAVFFAGQAIDALSHLYNRIFSLSVNNVRVMPAPLSVGPYGFSQWETDTIQDYFLASPNEVPNSISDLLSRGKLLSEPKPRKAD